MSKPLRSRVWNLLGTARTLGRTGVSVTVLAFTLGCSADTVLASVMPDMLETPEGETEPALYCEPTGSVPTLTPRRYL